MTDNRHLERPPILNPSTVAGSSSASYSKLVSAPDALLDDSPGDGVAHIPQSDRAMLEWKDLSFFVPAKKPASWKEERNVPEEKEALTDEMFKGGADKECTPNGLP